MNEKFSIIIPSYKEGRKPRRLLQSLKNSSFGKFDLNKVYLVTSGDNSDLESYCNRENLPIKILSQGKRQGKAGAINIALERIKDKNVILASADILLEEDTVKNILKKLENNDTGVVTARPVPKGPSSGFVGFFVNLIWKLHDRISNDSPKAGELIGFKKTFGKIPDDTAADEEFIKTITEERGYESKYARDSIVYNRGPRNIPGLFTQRRRVFIGHLDLKKRTGYSTPSMELSVLIKALSNSIGNKEIHPYLILSIFFETFARLSGWFRYKVLGENPYKWKKVG